MLSQSHSVNTSIESHVTHLLRWKELQSQSEKNALCEWTLRAMETLVVFSKLTYAVTSELT